MAVQILNVFGAPVSIEEALIALRINQELNFGELVKFESRLLRFLDPQLLRELPTLIA